MFLASRVFMGTPTKISSFKYFKFMGKAMIQPLVAIKYHSLHYYSLLLHFLVILFFSVFGNCMGGTLFEPGGRVRAPALYDSATIIRTSGYDILEESEGESSTFFILGIIPITNPISIDYALSQAVQKVPGGRSIVNIKVWHETHVMFPLGTVSVLKVKGKVIGNKEESERLRLEEQLKKETETTTKSNFQTQHEKQDSNPSSGGISVSGEKRSSDFSSSGISVGGKKKD
ncbi:hypothetical protein KQY10_15840 [Leptospira interrogans]|uniref:Uncharacterized protein n=1 Tax=Leptospira interrogans serovar Hardjo str. Norma TaxID=1279460 RepID=A0A0M4NCV0_LEPIR|nr:hypothetical protein [Leptospira interrogans]ALE41906.1 hypothetical protein G436_4781 [Leptospira interrogans serovar Hardjo str. Norma]ALO02411.1 hypothetical protein LIH_18905 [Leptospira interrogans serovar Hardjo-prajitno]EKO98518.1 hypothetical protein LEP1GSC057_2254 [Leptospira interrogans str. Brem 329]MCD1167046.1 hypothetical protein [Leptospira interrogans]MCH1884452.1 hypothetical protein [Leptospira interrogans]